ncbi:hypothetical protein H5410_057663 [Solanum commersonii]|uniref:Uncharacterized protein n=1 Tax=Solanum commersonii TaxID=4109 RepID=A0A9J5WNQ7_SOLCO|nr:hypothetical protein H5410_057663 [Solanum commersonii]
MNHPYGTSLWRVTKNLWGNSIDKLIFNVKEGDNSIFGGQLVGKEASSNYSLTDFFLIGKCPEYQTLLIFWSNAEDYRRGNIHLIGKNTETVNSQ